MIPIRIVCVESPPLETAGADIAGIAGIAMFISILVRQDSTKTEVRPVSAMVQLYAGGLLGLLLLWQTPDVPALLVAYGRYAVTWINQIDVKYIGEGRNSSIAVSTLKSSGATQFELIRPPRLPALHSGVGAENPVTSCDVHVLVYQACGCREPGHLMRPARTRG